MAWSCTRQVVRAGALSFVILPFAPGGAHAHAGERAFVLLLPTGYYLLGGTLAVAATFLALKLVEPASIGALFRKRVTLFKLPEIHRLWFSLPALGASVLLLFAGWAGPRDPLENALPTIFWTFGWVGLTLAHALFGNLWALINPLWGADWVIGRTLAGLGRTAVKPLSYPDRLGFWPAIAGLLSFAWFELVFAAPEDPDLLANAILVYVIVNLLAMRLFGAAAWLEKGETFSVFFRVIAGLAPLQSARVAGDEKGLALELRLPGAALIELAPRRLDFALFVLLALASVSFDGLSKTFWWLDLAGVNPLEFPGRSAMVEWNSLGLLASAATLAALYFGAEFLGRRIGRETPPGWPFAAVVSLAPISLAFHFAHYLTAFLVNTQYALLALSDPFHRHWDLLGLGENRVTTSFLNNRDDVSLIWNAQAFAIVLGHILAVVMAQALSQWGGHGKRVRFAGQTPLAALMILYTLFGLWLLSTPVAG